MWKSIATAVFKGVLGYTAKVSTNDNGRRFLICVYTMDYLDKEDVFKQRKVLQEIGFRQLLFYKPDVYTYLGIYQQNPWKLKPTYSLSEMIFNNLPQIMNLEFGFTIQKHFVFVFQSLPS